MSLHDVDKTGHDRSSPQPNYHDLSFLSTAPILNRPMQAHKTVAGGAGGNIGLGTIVDKNLAANTITSGSIVPATLGGPHAYVSNDGSTGDYTDIQTAINYVTGLGGGIVFIREGTYLLSEDITVYSNITLIGETSGGVVLDFQNTTFGIRCVGTGAYTAGSVAATNGSTTVTGTGTFWNSSMIGQTICLSGLVYGVTGVASTTSLTIDSEFEETTFSGGEYVIADFLSNITLQNFTVQNSLATTGAIYSQYVASSFHTDLNVYSSTVGLSYNYCSGWGPVGGFNVIGCDTGVYVDKAGAWSFKDFLIFQSTTVNMSLNKMVSCEISNFSTSSSLSDSIIFTACQEIDMFGFTNITNAGIGVKMTNCSDIEIYAGSVKSNTSDGIKSVSGNTRLTVHNVSLISNGGWGINIADATTTSSVITACMYVSNTTGSITDSGTSTIRSSNTPDNTTTNNTIIDTSTTLSSNSDARIATQKAVKTYVDAIGTSGTASKWTTARLLAGNSVDGSANVPFANKFVVQGTTDTGLSSAQFLGALSTGIVKNTTTTGVLSIAANSDLPVMSATVGGAVPTPPNNTTTFLRGDATWAVPPGGGSTITGPGSSVNNDIVTFSGTGGNVVQDSGKLLPTGTVVGTTDSQTQTNKVVSDVFMGGALQDAVVAHSAVLLASQKFFADDHLEVSSSASFEIPSTSSMEVRALVEQSNPHSIIPAGTVWMSAVSTAPYGWLLCNGTAVSRAQYPALFLAISTTFGVGDGVTTFNLPDFRGRLPLGAGLGTATGATVWSLATQPTSGAGGEQTHVQTTAELALHAHTDSGHSHTVNYHGSGAEAGGFGLTASASFTNRPGVSTSGGDSSNTGNAIITNTGSSTAFNILPPVSVVNFIIKT